MDFAADPLYPVLEDLDGKMPQKRFYRSRAHCNPLSHNDGFKYPAAPHLADWSPHYPNIKDPVVRFVDVGCGFGGLTIALAALYPDKVVLALEIRAKLCEYVRLRLDALRMQHPGQYQNGACLRTNCQRYLPNFFRKGQLEKLFFCFPDPHFKAKNHRRRIISELMLDEYAYVLAPNAYLYCITDVEELHHWHVAKCTEHAAFERIEGDDDELRKNDPCVNAMIEETEEGKKVTRMNGMKYFAVFRRREDSEMTPSWLSKLNPVEEK